MKLKPLEVVLVICGYLNADKLEEIVPDPHGDADSRTKDLLKTKLDLQLQHL